MTRGQRAQRRREGRNGERDAPVLVHGENPVRDQRGQRAVDEAGPAWPARLQPVQIVEPYLGVLEVAGHRGRRVQGRCARGTGRPAERLSRATSVVRRSACSGSVRHT